MAERSWQGVILAFAVGLAALGGGCRSAGGTAQWQEWSYKESEALTWAQQVERHRKLETNPAVLTEGYRVVPGQIPSNMMTESQRQAVQETYVRALRERVEQQMQEARTGRRQADQIEGDAATVQPW